MNSNDVNSIINNLCDKLGTTASKLIPEMAGYQIAKHSIWMFVSLIFIGVAVGLTIRLLWMRKNDNKMLMLYPDKIRKLDEEFKKTPIYNEQISMWSRADKINDILKEYKDEIIEAAANKLAERLARTKAAKEIIK